jgi:hypothetical protein
MQTDLPYPWSIYRDLQTTSSACTRSDYAWAIESGLNHVLSALTTNELPENQEGFRQSVSTAIATGAWNERNHARLLLKYGSPRDEPEKITERRLCARAELAQLQSRLGDADWQLLIALGLGFSYDDLASVSAKQGALRTRVSRLRMTLRQHGKRGN